MIVHIFKSHFLQIIALMLCITCIPNTYGMDAIKSKFKGATWKTAVATTLVGGCTLAHYGLSAYPLWSKSNPIASIKSYGNDELSQLDDASPLVADFVTEQVENHPKKHRIKNLKIKKAPFFAGGHSLNYSYVVVDKYSDLEPVLFYSHFMQDNQELNKKKLSYAATLNHEINHIIDNYTPQKIAANALIPFITQGVCYLLKKPFPKIKNDLLRNALKIPTGMLKGSINVMILSNFLRNHEQRADDAIPNNEQLLMALKKNLEEQSIYESRLIQSLDYKFRKPLPLSKKLYLTGKYLWFTSASKDAPFFDLWAKDKLPFYFNFSTHPSTQSRIKKLEQRIESLENQKRKFAFKEEELNTK